MPIGTGHKRDDRRRRVLRDERTVEDEAGTDGSKRRMGRRVRLRYGAAARRRHQPAIVDFLPIRWSALTLSLSLLGLLGISLIGGLAALAQTAEPSLALSPPALRSDSFGLMARVTVWSATLAALVTAVVASQLFLIRRHRRDDYRGHYSVWRWVALLAVLSSAEISTGLLSQLVPAIADRFMSTAGAQWCWTLLKLAAGTALVTRLFFEMREHRASTSLLLISWLGWGATLIAPLLQASAWWAPVVWASSDLVLSGSALVTLLWHARSVIREAATGGRRRHRVEAEGDEPSEAAVKPSRASRRSTKKAADKSDEKAAAEPETAVGAVAGSAALNHQPAASISRATAAGSSTSAKATTAQVAGTMAASAAASSVAASVRNEASGRVEPVRSEPRTTSSSPASRPLVETPKVVAASQEDEEDDDEEDDSDSSADANTAGMSKAQRRKLAKQQRRQQRNAA